MEKIRIYEKLSDDGALDMILIFMYASKKQAEIVMERIFELFCCDDSLKGMFQAYVANALSFMVKKYFGLNSKGQELLTLLELNYAGRDAIRDIVDFEIDYERRFYQKQLEESEKALTEKDNIISEMDKAIIEKDNIISEMDKEIALLEAKTKQLKSD